jgi:phosphoribosylformylglycinamidine synthase subunit PurQ / glutaminase
VVAGPGTNRDADVAFALERAGAKAEVRLAGALVADPEALRSAQLLVIAGGFSYGDALGAGRMLALELSQGATGDALRAFVSAGKPVLGICNGFQVLTRTGLLPGALGHNASGSFQCQWVTLTAEATTSVWTQDITEPIHCPIAHGEGRYVPADLAALEAGGQLALRYGAGTNPNGSTADIAGVCDPTGVVLGLMPHPENAVLARQLPVGGGRPVGLDLFVNGVTYAAGR